MSMAEGQEILNYLISQKRGMGIEQVAALTFNKKRTRSSLFYYELIDMSLNALHALLDRYNLSRYPLSFHSWNGLDMVITMPDRLPLPIIKKPKGSTDGLIIDFL